MHYIKLLLVRKVEGWKVQHSEIELSHVVSRDGFLLHVRENSWSCSSHQLHKSVWNCNVDTAELKHTFVLIRMWMRAFPTSVLWRGLSAFQSMLVLDGEALNWGGNAVRHWNNVREYGFHGTKKNLLLPRRKPPAMPVSQSKTIQLQGLLWNIASPRHITNSAWSNRNQKLSFAKKEEKTH